MIVITYGNDDHDYSPIPGSYSGGYPKAIGLRNTAGPLFLFRVKMFSFNLNLSVSCLLGARLKSKTLFRRKKSATILIIPAFNAQGFY